MDIKDEQIQNLMPLKRALFALKDLRTRLHAVENRKFEPIAIIGMSCRFPGGANDPDAYWRLLHNGVDAITEVPANRWDVDRYYDSDPAAPGKMVSRFGGFIDQVDQFDPHFFGISPREALTMDPQHRLLLETAWEALERAGLPPNKLAGSLTGVYVGMSTSDYARISLRAGDLDRIDPYVGTGGAFSVAAGRLSHILGLQGPTLSVDTACSSSLVAVHLACQALRAGQTNLALVGGVNLILSPEASVYMTKARALSPDGRCKAFDAAADGYGRGEGCVVVVLKRLSEAQADNNNVLAIIRGTSVNHDGPSSGLTVPNGHAQQAVIKAALADAGMLEPQSIDYLEAHGTGTPLGDPIEIHAAATVLCQNRSSNRPLYVGSVKTNIGHLEAAAGIAGLIKIVLALQHNEIPPQLHFHDPSPHIDWDALPLKVVHKCQSWQGRERLAGVSSFGFSGTNAHAILGSSTTFEPVLPQTARSFHVVTLSAKTESALVARKQQIVAYLDAHSETEPRRLAHTLNTGRAHFSHRLAVSGAAVDDLRAKLASATGRNASGPQPRITFFFSGEGGQYPGMGRELYKTQPTFSAALDECSRRLRPYLDIPLFDVLFADEAMPLAARIHDPLFMQPSLFALEYALASLWQSWGIRPAALMGYGVGEYVAACLAGVYSLEDGLRLVMERGRLMQELTTRGRMAVVFAPREAVDSEIAQYSDGVVVAAVNGPENVVISGDEKSVVEIIARLKQQGVDSKLLPVPYGFHSPLMAPILVEFQRTAGQISYAPPRIGLISNLTGRFFQATDVIDETYWSRHAREPVQFAAGMHTLDQHDYRIFVELGPDSTLLAIGRGCVSNQGVVWLPSLRQGKDDWQQVLETLAELYVQGVDIDWSNYESGYCGRCLILPVYPFERERYWTEAVEPASRDSSLKPGDDEHREIHPLLGRRLRSALKEVQFENQINLKSHPSLRDHQFFGTAVFPAMAYTEMALAAAVQVFGGMACMLENVSFHEALLIADGDTVTIQLAMTPEDGGGATFKIFSLNGPSSNGSDSWTLHVTGKMPIETHQDLRERVSREEIFVRCRNQISVEGYYKMIGAFGVHYGPRFRCIENLWKGDGEALGQVRLPQTLLREGGSYRIHPVLLDACLQMLGATFVGQVTHRDESIYVPTRFENVWVYEYCQQNLWCHARIREGNEPGSRIIVGDISLFGDDGEVFADVAGIHLTRVRRQAEISICQGGAGDVDEMAVTSLVRAQKSAKRLTQNELVPVGPPERQQIIMSYLREQLSRLLGTSAGKIEAQEPLINLGFDSLMAVALRSRVEADLGVGLTIADLLQGYGMAQVGATILDQLPVTLGDVAREDESGRATGDDSWNVVKL